MCGFNDVYDHSNKGFRCEENTVVRRHHRSKFVEEIFVNPADNIVLNFIERAVVEDTEEFAQKFVLQNGVIFR